MGQEEVPGHVHTRGDGRTEGKGGGSEEDGAEDGKINLRKNLDGTWRNDPHGGRKGRLSCHAAS